MCAGIDKTNRTDSFVAGVGEPKTGSGDVRELNVILDVVWWRPASGADSAGGGWLTFPMSPEG
jgi:hypothetical protein